MSSFIRGPDGARSGAALIGRRMLILLLSLTQRHTPPPKDMAGGVHFDAS
jgi:hypothetical protein